MHRTGLAPHGQYDEAVRWIAVRHAPDHIHLVAVLARQDGARPRFWNDYYRVGEACRAAEQRFGLQRTAPRDRTAGSRPTRAESEKARRQGRSEPPRIRLRRAVSTAAAASSGEQEFFAQLQQAGVVVRKRFSTHNPSQVTGYAALPTDAARSGGPVWYSGGKLAPDLTLPKLRHRWNGQAAGPPEGPAEPLTPAERAAIWDHVARTAAVMTEHIRRLSVADPGLAADAAWAAADAFHAGGCTQPGAPTGLGRQTSSLGDGQQPPRPGRRSPSPSAMSWPARQRRRTPAHPRLRAGHPRPRRRRASAAPPDSRPRTGGP